MKIEIEISTAELFALTTITNSPQDWADNAITNRARVAKNELKTTTEWMQAAQALTLDGGDMTDDWAVLLKGKTLKLFKTAEEKASALQDEMVK